MSLNRLPLLLIVISGLALPAPASADGILNKLKSWVGKGQGPDQNQAQTPATPNPAPSSAPASTAATKAATPKEEFMTAESACTIHESWVESQKFSADFWKEFHSMVVGKSSPAYGFSQALAFRTIYQEEDAKLLGEYWISRALYQAKLYHIAYNGFSAVASQAPKKGTVGIQLAAMACINQILRKYPSMPLPEPVTSRLAEYAKQDIPRRAKSPYWEYALLSGLESLGDTSKVNGLPEYREIQLKSLQNTLRDSSGYELLLSGILAARKLNYQLAVKDLEKFIAIPDKSTPLLRFNDRARLILARSYYSVGQFDKASLQFRAISKGSNDLAEVLSELAWSELMAQKYSDAIGVATSLQTGLMQDTFSPEGPMVMSMALNEICQYPSALMTINNFHKDYTPSFNWLAHWIALDQIKKAPNLYPYAVKFLKTHAAKKTDLPARIGTQWIRSAIFISHQEEINLMFEEKEAVNVLSKSGSKEQKKLAAELLAQFQVLKPKIVAAKKKMKYGDQLPDKILKDLGELKKKITLYRRYRDAAPVWRTVLTNYQKKVKPREHTLLANINQELAIQTRKMYTKLEEIAENNQLIEVEIYNGAGQDIVWQNAHPDYKKVAKDMASESGDTANAKVWDWGKAPTGETENEEIWEDEIGTFKAKTYDNCSSKDRYLALKRSRTGG